MSKTTNTTKELKTTTENTVHTAVDDLKALVRDAEEVLARAGDDAGDEIAELRQRLRAAITDSRSQLEQLREQAREQIERCDKYVQSHPYQSVGIAAAVGAFVGLLLGRRAA